MKINFSMEKCNSWKIIREKLVFLKSVSERSWLGCGDL